MAETEFSTTAKLPVETVWDFVRDMDNWASFLTGYQSHDKRSDTESIWTLKGDVGSLQRMLRFRVRVTEWAGPERVRFELEGENEPMTGDGDFRIARYEEASDEPSAPRRPGLLARWLEAILRVLFRRAHGEVQRGEGADSGPGEGVVKLTFRLRLEPGGPMAPMIDAIIKPAMTIAAEDLSQKIVAHLERARQGQP